MSRLDDLCKDFNKKYKADIVAKGIKRNKVACIPFTSCRVNYMLYGGLPRGMLVEFFGEENGGKTTSALDVVANAQQLFLQEWEEEIAELKQLGDKESADRMKYLQQRGPQKVVWCDAENTLDESWARHLGVDVDAMYIIRPDGQYAEQIFQLLIDMTESDEAGMIVIDSIPALMSKTEVEEDMEKKAYAGIAGPLTTFSKKMVPLCKKTHCLCLGINQLRDDINNPYNQYKTPGGRAWKFFCAVRMMFHKGEFFKADGSKALKSESNPAGHKVDVKLVKTKVCRPDRLNGFYTLRYDLGVDEVVDLVETAIQYDFVIQGGSWFSVIDPATGELKELSNGDPAKVQGLNKLIDLISQDDALYEYLDTGVTTKLSEGAAI